MVAGPIAGAEDEVDQSSDNRRTPGTTSDRGVNRTWMVLTRVALAASLSGVQSLVTDCGAGYF